MFKFKPSKTYEPFVQSKGRDFVLKLTKNYLEGAGWGGGKRGVKPSKPSKTSETVFRLCPRASAIDIPQKRPCGNWFFRKDGDQTHGILDNPLKPKYFIINLLMY